MVVANILYIPCHSVLEYDELRLLTSLGHNIFSTGSYFDPNIPAESIRPPLILRQDPEWKDIFYKTGCSVTPIKLSKEFLSKFNFMISTHKTMPFESNLRNIPKSCEKIWRGIGQATPHTEVKLRDLKKNGVRLIRYSPMESRTTNFAGQDGLIRFFKKESEFISNDTKTNNGFLCYNAILQRSQYNDWNFFKDFVEYNNFEIFGGSNESIKNYHGFLSTEEQLCLFKRYSKICCLSSYPAPYTLGFLEAVMSELEIFICKNGHESDERFMFGQNYNRIDGNIYSFVANREIKDLFSEKSAKIEWNKLLG